MIISPTIISIFVPVSLLILFLLYLLFRRMFKVISKAKVFFIALVCYLFLAVISCSLYYVYENHYLFYNQSKYYVTGKVREINRGANMMKVYVTSNTLNDEKQGVLKIQMTEDTAYRSLMIDANEKYITLDDINAGDTVEVMCKEDKKENTNTVVAIKVVKRNPNT